MTKDGIIEKVRAIMNEIGAEENLSLLSENTVKLSGYIESVIPDAVNAIVVIAPTRFLNATSQAIPTTTTDGISICDLPNDFLRFVSLKLDTWKRAVSVAYPYGSDRYNAQHNPVTRAGSNKPVCAFSFSKKGNMLECCPSGNMEYFFYVKCANDSNLMDVVKESLFLPVCYMCGYLVYNIFEMSNTAERMKNIAIELIPKD